MTPLDSLRTNFYLQDILSQPAALRQALGRADFSALAALGGRLRAGEFDRLVLTGMGASYYGVYAAYLRLADAGLPVFWIDAAELLQAAPGLLTPRSLVWGISQSGRSAEMLTLVRRLESCPAAALIGMTNDLSSPLAQAAGARLFIDAEVERTVSTRTYLNTVALSQLAALALLDLPLAPALAELIAAVEQLAAYFAIWEAHFSAIAAQVGVPAHLYMLGRGASYATACMGALIQQEAAKFPAIGLQSAEFRHGPLEVSAPPVTVISLAGGAGTRPNNLRLHRDLVGHGARGLWLEAAPAADLPAAECLPAAHAQGCGLPLAEIAPLQLLSVHLAHATGHEPGKFYFIGKVTLTE